jgi:hypothetical protein
MNLFFAVVNHDGFFAVAHTDNICSSLIYELGAMNFLGEVKIK